MGFLELDRGRWCDVAAGADLGVADAFPAGVVGALLAFSVGEVFRGVEEALVGSDGSA